MRRNAGLNAVPRGVGPGNTDNNILYSPTTAVDPTSFNHPHCLSTDITP